MRIDRVCTKQIYMTQLKIGQLPPMFVNKNLCISHTFRNSSISLNAKLVKNGQVLPNIVKPSDKKC